MRRFLCSSPKRTPFPKAGGFLTFISAPAANQQKSWEVKDDFEN